MNRRSFLAALPFVPLVLWHTPVPTPTPQGRELHSGIFVGALDGPNCILPPCDRIRSVLIRNEGEYPSRIGYLRHELGIDINPGESLTLDTDRAIWACGPQMVLGFMEAER